MYVLPYGQMSLWGIQWQNLMNIMALFYIQTFLFIEQFILFIFETSNLLMINIFENNIEINIFIYLSYIWLGVPHLEVSESIGYILEKFFNYTSIINELENNNLLVLANINIFHISRFYSTSNYKDIESPNFIEIESGIESESKIEIEIESKSKTDINFDKKYSEKEFFSLFIGFVDGDGYIDIGEQKQYNKKTGDLVNSTIRIALGIGVDKRDLSLLETFQEKLGIGSIKPIPNTNKYRYLISRSEILKIIIPLMVKYNVYFLNYNRHMQYSLAKHIIDNNIKQWKILEKTKVLPVFRPNSYKYYSEFPQFSN